MAGCRNTSVLAQSKGVINEVALSDDDILFPCYTGYPDPYLSNVNNSQWIDSEDVSTAEGVFQSVSLRSSVLHVHEIQSLLLP